MLLTAERIIHKTIKYVINILKLFWSYVSIFLVLKIVNNMDYFFLRIAHTKNMSVTKYIFQLKSNFVTNVQCSVMFQPTTYTPYMRFYKTMNMYQFRYIFEECKKYFTWKWKYTITFLTLFIRANNWYKYSD